MRRTAATLALMFFVGLVIGSLFAGPVAGLGVAFTVVVVGGISFGIVAIADTARHRRAA